MRKDKTLILFTYTPIIVLLVFFIFPLFTFLKYVPLVDWSIFTTNYYISVPRGEGIKILHFGKFLIVKVVGYDFGIIGNSLVNAITVTIIASIMGTAIAIAVSLYNFPGRRLLAVLASIPLLITPFVGTYVVKLFFGPSLIGNTLSYFLQHLTEPFGFKLRLEFDGLAGVSLAQILAFYPIVFVNVMATIAAIDASLIEQALNLGASGFTLIRRVLLPLLMPGILAGATLVFILALEDISAPIIFNFKNIMSYQVYYFFQTHGVGDEVTVAAISFLMLIFASIPLIVVRKYLSLKYTKKLVRGTPRQVERTKMGRRGLLIVYLILFPFVIISTIPQVGTLILAFSSKWTGPLPTPLPPERIFANFETIIDMAGVLRSIYNSIRYLIFAIMGIAVIGFMAGYSAARAKIPGSGLLDILASLPIAIPGLVVAFSYFIYFKTFFGNTILDPILFPGTVLTIALMIRKMPFTVRALFSTLLQIPEELEESALSLGSTRLKVIRKIVLPLAKRGFIAGLLLSAIYILSEVSTSVTIGALKGTIISADHAGPITFAILSLTTQGSIAAGETQPQAKAAALATILMALEAGVLLVSTRLTKRISIAA